jgi:hypothetical protein
MIRNIEINRRLNHYPYFIEEVKIFSQKNDFLNLSVNILKECYKADR